MSFTTKKKTLADVLNDASPGILDRALAQVKLGRILKPVKVTFAGLEAAASIDITSAAAKAAATINQGLDDLATTDRLPAILAIKSCRVTAGAATAGCRVQGDSGSTPLAGDATGPGVVRLSDDGKTLTFEGNVTGFVLEYIPRSDVDLGTEYVLS